MASSKANLQVVTEVVEDHLSCRICFEPYMDPKFLECFHTFCRRCIEKYVEKNFKDELWFPCPTCRQKIKIPDDGIQALKSNFFITGMQSDYEKVKAVMEKDAKGTPCCDPCLNDSQEVPSETRCLECEEFLCHTCTSVHRKMKAIRDHKIFAIQDMHSEKYQQELRSLQFAFCRRHLKEPVELYCTICKACICVKCKVLSHEQHKSVPLEDIAAETQKTLVEMFEQLKEKQRELATAVGVTKAEIQKNADANCQTKKDIEQRAILIHQMIDETVLRMCDDVSLTTKLNEKTLDAVENLQSLDLGSMTSIIGFIEPLLKHGKPAEIMEMNEQCQRRFHDLLNKNPEPLPLLGMPFLQTIAHTEKAIQQVMGTVASTKEDVTKVGEFRIDLDKGSGERLTFLTVTSDDDIITGTFTNDEHQRKVYVYSVDGVRKNSFTVPGLAGLAALSEGRISVTEWPNNNERVNIYTTDGHSTHSFQCVQPQTIAVDSFGRQVVLSQNEEVRIYTPDGNEVMRFDQQKTKAAYTYFKHVSVNQCHSDDIIMGDPNDHCLYVYNSSGQIQFTYGIEGNGLGQFDMLTGVCCNSKGEIVAADPANERIHLVTPTGGFVYFLLTKQEHGVVNPQAVSHLQDDSLVVGERNGTIKIFKYL